MSVSHAFDLLDELGDGAGSSGVPVLARRTGLSKSTVHALLATLEEREAGLCAVAAPVRGHSGGVAAAMGLAGPTARFNAQRVAELLNALSAAAGELRADACRAPDGSTLAVATAAGPCRSMTPTKTSMQDRRS